MTAGAPVLVTGLPRSGTTWLARQLTRAPGVALAGREPMNPRGNQFGLGGSLDAWTRLPEGCPPRQRRALRRVYRGWEPRAYSRLGVRQWSAPLPWVRVIVKDPFALLSLATITEVTGATPVVLFRHPGALLASYRRMGWAPAVTELAALDLPGATMQCPPSGADDVAAMAWFWGTCYRAVLADLTQLPAALLVDHAELSRGGDAALGQLMSWCGLDASRLRSAKAPELATTDAPTAPGPVLHNFRRTVVDVTESWRSRLSTPEAERLEALVATDWETLRDRRARLDAHAPQDKEGAT